MNEERNEQKEMKKIDSQMKEMTNDIKKIKNNKHSEKKHLTSHHQIMMEQ